MFYILTRKSLIILLVIMLCIAMPLTVAITSFKTSPSSKYVIVIDAGHGGVDLGVNGITTGVAESELNLIIAKILKESFTAAGFKVVMTRSTAEGLYGIKTPGFKNRDMRNRKKIIQDANPDIVLSIHMNFYSSPIRRGLQVFYTNKDHSKDLAREIQNIVNMNMNYPITGRNLSILYGDYYILQCVDAPSVIVECGFLSNPLDEALLVSPEYQLELSYYIFTGVMSYVNTKM